MCHPQSPPLPTTRVTRAGWRLPVTSLLQGCLHAAPSTTRGDSPALRSRHFGTGSPGRASSVFLLERLWLLKVVPSGMSDSLTVLGLWEVILGLERAMDPL